MTRTVRILLLFEAVSFFAASLVHSGVGIAGHEHARARVAEAVIGFVLLAGAIAGAVRTEWARGAALATQSFALLGTLVGLFTIAIGVGPRTVPDLMFHAGILIVLAWGLRFVVGARTGASPGARDFP